MALLPSSFFEITPLFSKYIQHRNSDVTMIIRWSSYAGANRIQGFLPSFKCWCRRSGMDCQPNLRWSASFFFFAFIFNVLCLRFWRIWRSSIFEENSIWRSGSVFFFDPIYPHFLGREPEPDWHSNCVWIRYFYFDPYHPNFLGEEPESVKMNFESKWPKWPLR